MTTGTERTLSGEGFAFFRWHCMTFPFFSHHVNHYFTQSALDDWRHGYR